MQTAEYYQQPSQVWKNWFNEILKSVLNLREQTQAGVIINIHGLCKRQFCISVTLTLRFSDNLSGAECEDAIRPLPSVHVNMTQELLTETSRNVWNINKNKLHLHPRY